MKARITVISSVRVNEQKKPYARARGGVKNGA
jgi:hypothetical protein